MQPETILLDVDVRNRDDALAFIAAAIGRAHGMESGPIARALSRRERSGSTALGHGFAIPHARIVGLQRPLTLFMRSRAGVDFLAPDGGPVRHFMAILVPDHGDRQDHLDLLRLVAELFSDPAFHAALDAARSAEAAAVIFREGVTRLRDNVSDP